MTQAELEAQKNTLLASGQPITATIHRSWGQRIIDELYNVVSRGKVLATTPLVTSASSGDKLIIVRGADTKLIDKDLIGATLIPIIAAGVSGDPINMNAQHQHIVIFNGATAFGDDPRSFSFVNDENLKIFDFIFELNNASGTLQLPVNYRSNDIRVYGGNVWHAEQEGTYKMHAVYNGTIFVTDFYGPYV
jgi:hypothetical protein